MSEIIVGSDKKSPRVLPTRLSSLGSALFWDALFCAGWSAFAWAFWYVASILLPNPKLNSEWERYLQVVWIGWPWLLLVTSGLLGISQRVVALVVGAGLFTGVVWLAAKLADLFLPVYFKTGFLNWAFWVIVFGLLVWPWILLIGEVVCKIRRRSNPLPGAFMVRWFAALEVFAMRLQAVIAGLTIAAIGICVWIATTPSHEPLVDKGFDAVRDTTVSTYQGLVDGLQGSNQGSAPSAASSATTSPAGSAPPKKERRLSFEW